MADSSAIKFRVLTVNTHKGFALFNRRFILHELREAVRGVSADVVFLQEVIGSSTRIVRPGRRRVAMLTSPHYEYLADSIWSDFAYGRNAVHTHGDHGNAVLSKFPITRYENRDVSIRGPERRGLLHCVLRIPGREIDLHVICVHLGLKETHRYRQLEMLCEMVHAEVPDRAPLLVAGDFNDWQVRAHGVLERCAGLHEVFVHAHGRAARTFPSRWPVLKLDRIYVRNASVHRPVVLPSRPWAHLSDHAPLAAEITL